MKLISRCISSTTRPHTAHSLSVPGLLVRCTPAIPVIRYQTTASTIPPAANESKSRRPSPYRLLPARTFLAHFAPLHVAGWRLDILPNVAATSRLAAQSSGSASTPTPIVDESGDLQDHLLVRAYSFEQTREGWEGAMRLVQRIGEVVADEDHHPKILICPTSDYYPSAGISSPTLTTAGYVVHVSTHTHTPMPVLSSSSSSSSSSSTSSSRSTAGGETGVKMRPGVTGKDLRLADAVEEAWREITGHVEV